MSETVWTPTNAEGRFTKITASRVRTLRTTRSQSADGGSTTLVFTIDSAFTKPVPGVDVSVIFRDGRGRIVGGVDHVISRGNFDGTGVPPGRSAHELSLEVDPPAAVDDNRTEVYVFANNWPIP